MTCNFLHFQIQRTYIKFGSLPLYSVIFREPSTNSSESSKKLSTKYLRGPENEYSGI